MKWHRREQYKIFMSICWKTISTYRSEVENTMLNIISRSFGLVKHWKLLDIATRSQFRFASFAWHAWGAEMHVEISLVIHIPHGETMEFLGSTYAHPMAVEGFLLFGSRT